jgi:hypothetical protein
MNQLSSSSYCVIHHELPPFVDEYSCRLDETPSLESSSSSSTIPFVQFFFILYYFSVVGSFFLMIGIAYFLQKLLKQWWKLRHFRSPFALPLIGNCYNPEAFTLFPYMASLRKQFGPNFVIYLFTNPFLVTMDPHVVRKVLSDSKSFENHSLSSHLAFKVFGEGLLFPSAQGESRQLKKSIILSYYSLSRVSKSVPALNDVLSVAFSQLFEEKLLAPAAAVASSSETDKTSPRAVSVNLESFFVRVALRSFLNYSCGVDLRGDLTRENEVGSTPLSSPIHSSDPSPSLLLQICESLLAIEKSIGKVNVLPTRFFSSTNDSIVLGHTNKVPLSPTTLP